MVPPVSRSTRGVSSALSSIMGLFVGSSVQRQVRCSGFVHSSFVWVSDRGSECIGEDGKFMRNDDNRRRGACVCVIEIHDRDGFMGRPVAFRIRIRARNVDG